MITLSGLHKHCYVPTLGGGGYCGRQIMVIIQAFADTFVSTPDLVEDERVAQEWAEVVVEVGTARADAEEADQVRFEVVR